MTADYRKLHDFLVQTGNREFTYARFDWMQLEFWEAKGICGETAEGLRPHASHSFGVNVIVAQQSREAFPLGSPLLFEAHDDSNETPA